MKVGARATFTRKCTEMVVVEEKERRRGGDADKGEAGEIASNNELVLVIYTYLPLGYIHDGMGKCG